MSRRWTTPPIPPHSRTPARKRCASAFLPVSFSFCWPLPFRQRRKPPRRPRRSSTPPRRCSTASGSAPPAPPGCRRPTSRLTPRKCLRVRPRRSRPPPRNSPPKRPASTTPRACPTPCAASSTSCAAASPCPPRQIPRRPRASPNGPSIWRAPTRRASGAPAKRAVTAAPSPKRSLGFSDVGAMWGSNYDMPPAEFADTMDRLWQQVRPLYVELHTYVRHRLTEQYGEDVVPPGEPIPAHLLGNMWAQSWTNIFPLVAPEDADPGYDLTERIREEDLSPEEMVEYGEGFFTSLGLDPLPETFWARSLFEKPADRQVVCHASAWDVDDQDDVRIKMCIEPTAEDFQTIHHELGHNYYQRAYKEQPPLFRGSANDGFHEALGDAVALSVTPQYLQQVGLIDEVPPPAKDIGLLLRSALDKVAFLPFGLMVDKWRWQVFSGEVAPAEYNEAWWDLREQYQGIAPPEERPEKAFDPGAKYHIPANTPYSRYFLARILQFQFHRSLCEEASPDGQLDGPLHRCSVYGSERAGDRLYEMMAMGKERPWPEALEALTGEREMDASAMIDYYAPLMDWLREQNDRLGAESGW
ncbi:MAG: hypothetical protein BRD52_04345 [Bacteroidetes bacterium SW_4_67_19]|nr:MAG: hypothetical protein BRD52_04345 [Bacteroidetes bacterium SW_4_67_19]